jgi:5-methylcytosine-specific restriction protein A
MLWTRTSVADHQDEGGAVATFILTWNPDKWTFEEGRYEELVDSTARGDTPLEAWSVGVRRRGVSRGDRAFLLRQHRDRGIVAAGQFTSDVYPGPHWDGTAREASYADAEWDTWLPVADRLSIDLVTSQVPEMRWDRLQASGVQLPEAQARSLERLWEAHLQGLGRDTPRGPDEVSRSEGFPEGAVTRVLVNRYERDPRARRACLDHYGYDCSVCGFNFAQAYGSLGDAYIHVHHTRELSALGPGYQVDRVQDLRPVCPNCHAMLHQRRPPLSIEELKPQVRGRGPGGA